MPRPPLYDFTIKLHTHTTGVKAMNDRAAKFIADKYASLELCGGSIYLGISEFRQFQDAVEATDMSYGIPLRHT